MLAAFLSSARSFAVTITRMAIISLSSAAGAKLDIHRRRRTKLRRPVHALEQGKIAISLAPKLAKSSEAVQRQAVAEPEWALFL